MNEIPKTEAWENINRIYVLGVYAKLEEMK